MADPKKISQLTPAASVNANDYTVLVDGNNSTNKRATISQILASGVIGGTVTSVNATGSNGIGVSGGPITTSGTLNISLGAITPTSVTASGSITGANLSGTNTGDQTIQLVGDVEAAAGAPTLTTSIASGAVTNAKLANMTGPSIKGRVAAGVGAVSDLSAAQVATILPAVIGDSGSGGTQGLVPAPAAGDAAAKKFLRADATWAAPAINDLLPSQSGQSGKVLKSDGTNVAWQADNGGSGTVTSVGIAGGTDINVSGSPVTTSGTITVGLTASGVGAGTYGSATQVPAITVDSKGRVTSAANTAIAIPSTAVSGLASVATTGAYSSLTGTPSLGTISSQNSNNVNITGGSITGISALAVNSGGTGATSAVDARTNLGLGTIATQAANNVAITGGTMSNVQVSGLPTPVNASDAATKYYVDTFAQGLNPQAAVRAGTTGNITLSGLQTIDGVTLVASDRVLVKNQTNSAENGIYVAAAGAWSRATDANTAAELARGNYYMITEGTANIGDGWVIQTAPSNLGVDPVVFALFTNTVAAVSSISGTASQISASSSTGAITLSLPNTLVAPGTFTASGGITNTAIGASNPSTGAFTTLSATGNLTVSGTGQSNFSGKVYAPNLYAGTSSGSDYSAGTVVISVGSDTFPALAFGGANYGWGFLERLTDGDFVLGRRNGSTTNTAVLTLGRATGNATLAGNLTVSGTGTHSFNGPVSITGTTASNLLRLTKSGAGSKTFGIDNALDFRIYADNGSTQLFKLTDSGDTTITGNLTVSGTGTSSVAGSLGIGTTTTEGGSLLHLVKSSAGGEGSFLFLDNPAASTLGSKAGIKFATSSGSSFAASPTGEITNVITNAGTGASALDFGTFDGSASAIRMRLSATGNLLIGTTTDGGQKLQVSGSAAFTGVLTVSGTSGNTFNAGTIVTPTITSQVNQAFRIISTSTAEVQQGFLQTGNFGYYIQVGGSSSYPLMLQPAGSNVLIGTTTDNGQRLQVNGTAAISSTLTVSGTGTSSFAGPLTQTNTASGVSASFGAATSLNGNGVLEVVGSNGSSRAANQWVVASNGNSIIYVGSTPGTASSGTAVLSLGAAQISSAIAVNLSSATASTSTTTGALVVSGGVGVAGAVNVGGAISIGNTVQTAASVASTHKVTISIGGTTYYLLATNV